MRSERAHRHRDGKIGFACSGRTDADCNRIGTDHLNIFFLPERLCLDRLAGRCDAHNVVGERSDLVLAPLADHRHHIAHILIAECFALVNKRKQARERSHSKRDALLVAKDLDLCTAAGDSHTILLFDQPDIFVKAAEQSERMLHPVYIYQLLYHVFSFVPLPGACLKIEK